MSTLKPPPASEVDLTADVLEAEPAMGAFGFGTSDRQLKTPTQCAEELRR
jgi:hypothetical protein